MVFTGNRAEYGLLFPVLKEIKADPTLKLSLVVAGGHFSAALGGSVSEIRKDGFTITASIRPVRSRMTTAEEFAYISTAMTKILSAHRPDILLLLGDRRETFAAAGAALCAETALAHMAGGDITNGGLKDDVFRHAITRLAHLHFPFTKQSADVLKKCGEEKWRINCAGSTAADNFKLIKKTDIAKQTLINLGIPQNAPFVMFTQHPEAQQPGKKQNIAARAAKTALKILKELGIHTIINAPNNDPGWENVMAAVESFGHVSFFKITRHLGREKYLGLMAGCSAVIGNSSSGLLESPIAGVAAVNIGNRQKDRADMGNVVHCGYTEPEIRKAILRALSPAFRKKAKNTGKAFGTGNSAQKIVKTLKSVPIDSRLFNKKLTF